MHILWDIDGVINIDRNTDNTTIIKHDYGRWYCKNNVLDYLYDVAMDDNIDNYWISTWVDSSNIINDKIGIDQFDVIDVLTFSIGWQKWTAIKEFIDDHYDEPIIIIDDDFPDYLLDELPNNVHVIIPDYTKGLNINKLDELLKVYM